MSHSIPNTEMMLDAARQCIVDHGLNGASLRLVAQQAGISVGSLNYHFGDRLSLIEALQTHEAKALANRQSQWIERVRALGVPDDDQLAQIVVAWFDDHALNYRSAAIARCELVLQAARLQARISMQPQSDEAFWRELLMGRADAPEMGMILARYCLDELPFSLLLVGDPDYRLLRAATIAALVGEPSSAVEHKCGHDRIVERLGGLVSSYTDGTSLLAKPQKAVLAERIADLLEHEGLAVLTHRRAAQKAEVSASSVAHHFPQQRDLVRGGIEAMYSRMRRNLGPATGPATSSGAAVILLTHEMALAALRDPQLNPFAIDMRRRRGENIKGELSRKVLAGQILDGAAVQALVMAMIGGMIGMCAACEDDRQSGISAIEAYRSVVKAKSALAPQVRHNALI